MINVQSNSTNVMLSQDTVGSKKSELSKAFKIASIIASITAALFLVLFFCIPKQKNTGGEAIVTKIIPKRESISIGDMFGDDPRDLFFF